MENRNVDALFIYNERESVVDSIARSLDSNGYSTFLWRRDVKPGEVVDEAELQLLKEASNILVFLGDEGWGPNHIRRVKQAKELNRELIPIVIGKPSQNQKNQIAELFINERYIDIPKISSQAINDIIKRLGPPKVYIDTSRFDEIVGTLTDGSEEQRLMVLEQLTTNLAVSKEILSAKLRDQISKRFNPTHDNNLELASRDPKSTSSIRSWMISALIWLYAELPENKKLIIEHLNPEYEPNDIVRYWTLAGLFQRNVSYLALVLGITTKDRIPAVLYLSKAIQNPTNEELIAEFRTKLMSSDFSESWGVLRTLRIVPMPQLAKEISDIISKKAIENTTYDALYTLTSKTMSVAAAPFLEESIGLRDLVTLILEIGRISRPYLMSDYSPILLPYDSKEVAKYVDQARTNPATRHVATALRNQLNILWRVRKNFIPFRPGYAPDIIDPKNDLLNISEDVKTLTAIIMSRGVTLPLAIGLFGSWGTGKSFFMQSIKNEIKAIQDANTNRLKSDFCVDVVQIEFNAWHYVDANLLASLVNYIFEELSNYVLPELTEEQKFGDFIAQLETKKDDVKKIEQETIILQAQIDTKEQQYKSLSLERTKTERIVRNSKIEDIKDILTNDQKATLDKSLDELGIKKIQNSVKDLEVLAADFNSVRGRLASLIFSVFNSTNKYLVIFLLFLILILIPCAGWWIKTHLVTDKFIANISILFTEISVFIASFATVIRSAMTRVNSTIQTLESTREIIDNKIKENASQPSEKEKNLTTEISKLKEEHDLLTNKLAEETTAMIEVKRKIDNLKEESNLIRFLSDRRVSNEYQKHLGIISTIRKDFTALIRKLDFARQLNDGKHRPIERIVLYIDDLDRCPPEKVVEVLQAVHLLLAYPLFVVIVGVDPHWLLRSLKQAHTVFRQVEPEDDISIAWRGSPQSFLEKIFQIPFRLHNMSNEGYGKLIGDLFSTKDGIILKQNENGQDIDENPPGVDGKDSILANTLKATGHENGGGSLEQNNSNQEKEPPELSDITTKAIANGDVGNENGSITVRNDQTSDNGKEVIEVDKEFEVDEQSLTVKEWEVAFSKELFEFIPTPRAAKRFANVYRIIKASVNRDKLVAFEGSTEILGEFQVPMLLLAILVGHSEHAQKLFPVFYAYANKGKGLSEALDSVKRLEKPDTVLVQLVSKIETIVNMNWFPIDSQLVLDWIGKVSRFSFEPVAIVY